MNTELERLLDAYTKLCLDIVERERARDAVKQQISNLFVKNGQTQKTPTPLVFAGEAPSVIVGAAKQTETPGLIEALTNNPDTSATKLAQTAGLNYGSCIAELNRLLMDGKVAVDKSKMPYRWRVA